MTGLLRQVEVFLRRTGIPATRLGRMAMNDPRFVLDLRAGRTPRPATRDRMVDWMAGALAAQRARPIDQAPRDGKYQLVLSPQPPAQFALARWQPGAAGGGEWTLPGGAPLPFQPTEYIQ